MPCNCAWNGMAINVPINSSGFDAERETQFRSVASFKLFLFDRSSRSTILRHRKIRNSSHVCSSLDHYPEARADTSVNKTKEKKRHNRSRRKNKSFESRQAEHPQGTTSFAPLMTDCLFLLSRTLPGTIGGKEGGGRPVRAAN